MSTYWHDMQQAHRDVMASVERSDPDLYAIAWQHYGAFRSYADYIQSERWREKALEAKRRAGFRCQGCNASANLQSHHRTYDNLGNEPPEDLTVLCCDCHEKLRKEARHA